MRAVLRDNTYIVATIEADDSHEVSVEIGSEIHQLFVGGWSPRKLTIEFDAASSKEVGGDGE